MIAFTDIWITVIVLSYLLVSIVINKQFNYLFSGILIIFLGIFPFVRDSGMIGFDITLYPVFNFAAYFIVVFAARDFVSEGFKESSFNNLKWPIFFVGFCLLIFTTIPTLYSMNVLSFNLPVYPQIFNNIIYIICGIFLIITDFIVLATKD